MIKIDIVVSGEVQTNCYLIYDSSTKAAAIVDPGADGAIVISNIQKLGLKPEILINTHGHFDHILDDDKLRKQFNIPLAVHKDEVEMLADGTKNSSAFFGKEVRVLNPEILLSDEQVIELSFTKFQVIATPGHTKGGICLLFDNFIVTGDTLFKEDVGRTDLKGGSYRTLMLSLEKLKKLPPELIVYPGHGDISTIDYEMKNNPYLR
ncbi:MAG: MBL fold metallo-hydrolase [Elusimicrobiota bacterium]|jgi:glyoxylase-like metal-dependent hydrolase (beta-lactamase superfamily II)|nr:MBL fold metallo-hydrolase [Elusimicrobiota bacterium]